MFSFVPLISELQVPNPITAPRTSPISSFFLIQIRAREMHFIGRFVLCTVSSSVIQSVTPIIGLLAVVGVLKLTDAKITTEQV